ncbi:hypothetical protein [Pannonibacter sp. SL95]|uniref:hypothetical protein n=1 Tax=Pannonibacter sp. SL95 TaxID=2995153 RepID=UPI002274AD17|nr:hypothetical protein [Pannonibacter sp. SL95]MCY1708346.1 hypothetical protein [Pannonibacter sp. SL95]
MLTKKLPNIIKKLSVAIKDLQSYETACLATADVKRAEAAEAALAADNAQIEAAKAGRIRQNVEALLA